MIKILLLQLFTISLLNATALQDMVDKAFEQGKYKNNAKMTKQLNNNKLKEDVNETKLDYSKATSLQDAVDMYFNQGKYSK
jgi:major membrane immunogen (membrane-anchored lipoprotein)